MGGDYRLSRVEFLGLKQCSRKIMLEKFRLLASLIKKLIKSLSQDLRASVVNLGEICPQIRADFRR